MMPEICIQSRRMDRVFAKLSEAISVCFNDTEFSEETSEYQDDDQSEPQDHVLDTSQLITLINQAEEGTSCINLLL